MACRAALWGSRRRYAPAGGAASEVDRSLCRQHDGLLPLLQVAGPKLQEQPATELPVFDLLLGEQIHVEIVENEGMDDVETVVRKTIEKYPVSWVTCRETLGYLRDSLTEQDIQVLHIGDFDIKHLLQVLPSGSAWPFLQVPHALHGQATTRMPLEEIEQMCMEESVQGPHRAPFWVVPRAMAKERFIIHAFSGRRRPGDFQHFIEQAQQSFPEVTIFTISVDLMVDLVWGDVSKDSVRSFWLNAVRQRQVVAAMAGESERLAPPAAGLPL